MLSRIISIIPHDLLIPFGQLPVGIVRVHIIQHGPALDYGLLHGIPKAGYPVCAKTELLIERYGTCLVYRGQDAVDEFGSFGVFEVDPLGL